MPALLHLLKSRLFTPPLALLLLALTTTLALVVGILQGEALHKSRRGVEVLRGISGAAVQAEWMQQAGASFNSNSTYSTTSSNSISSYGSSTISRALLSPAPTTLARSSSAPTSKPASRLSGNRDEDANQYLNRGDEQEEGGGGRTARQAEGAAWVVGAELDDETFRHDTARFVVEGVTDAGSQPLLVSEVCAAALARPIVYIERLRTMSLTFIGFAVWAFGLSIVGLLNESRPHLAAIVISHALAGVYAVFQVTQTKHFREIFHRDVSLGACAGFTTLVPSFWKKTLSFQLGVAIVQPIGTLLIALVAWKLADQLKWTTFRKTGADRRVARAHTLGLLFELALLVAAFFIVASQAIWLHELFTYPWHTSIRTSVPHLLGRRYRIFLLVFTVLLAPLLVVGWLGVKRKSTWLMMGFCAGKVGFLAHTILLATQKVYMSTCSAFRFLTFLTVVAVVFTSATFFLGVACIPHICSGSQSTSGMTVDWIPTSFPSDAVTTSTCTTSRSNLDIGGGSESSYDFEKALDATSGLRSSVPLGESNQRPQTLVVTLPRRLASFTPGDDAALQVVGSSTSPLSSASSFAAPSFPPSPLPTRAKPLLRIDTTSAACSRSVGLKQAIAVNPDVVAVNGGGTWSEGGNTGRGGNKSTKMVASAEERGRGRTAIREQQIRWSDSTQATASTAALAPAPSLVESM